MKLIITDSVEPRFRKSIETANRYLERLLAPRHSETAGVVWEQEQSNDYDGSTIIVKLRDTNVEKTHQFYDFELTEESYVRRKLRSLWDEILSAQIQALLHDETGQPLASQGVK
jgi:hypothetical protein